MHFISKIPTLLLCKVRGQRYVSTLESSETGPWVQVDCTSFTAAESAQWIEGEVTNLYAL